MSDLKLLFDENFGIKIVNSLADFLSWHISRPELSHINDHNFSGLEDDEWLKKVKDDNWIIVSCDRAKRYGGPKLPIICKELGIRHILVSSGLHKDKQFEKARAVVYTWPEILGINNFPKGSKFVLRYNTSRNPTLEFRDSP
jgi:hypothetical protein